MTKVDLATLDIAHHFGGGVYAKETRIPAGHMLVQHKHKHDHLSILATGTAHLFRGSEVMRITGPKVVEIVAQEHHTVEALTDCVWLCVHSTAETDPAKIDEVLIIPSDIETMRQILESKA